MRSQSEYYLLSRRVVYCTAATLFASFLLNITAVFSKCNMLAHFYGDKGNALEKLFLPVQLRPVALTIEDSENYGLHDDSDWDSLIPNHGFVRLPSSPDGPSTVDKNGQAYFAVSMYHQLHCLNGFRHLTVASLAGNQTKHNIDHAVHCLSYLRQLLLCHADTALEPARLADTVTGGTTQAVYGEGTTHRCHDWTQVRSWVEDNYQAWKAEDGMYEASEGHADHASSDHGHHEVAAHEHSHNNTASQ